MVVLDSIIEHLLIPLTEDDVLLLLDADNGNAEAQNDLALLFLANKKFREAVYWLKLAIKQGNTSAMHCLGRAYMDGTGVPKDENLGLMWIAKAAAGGHVVSRAQMAGIIQSLPSKLPEGLQEFFRK